MTTGCVCAKPVCGGLAPGRGQMCPGCRLEAIRNPVARTAKRAVQGPDLRKGLLRAS